MTDLRWPRNGEFKGFSSTVLRKKKKEGRSEGDSNNVDFILDEREREERKMEINQNLEIAKNNVRSTGKLVVATWGLVVVTFILVIVTMCTKK